MITIVLIFFTGFFLAWLFLDYLNEVRTLRKIRLIETKKKEDE